MLGVQPLPFGGEAVARPQAVPGAARLDLPAADREHDAAVVVGVHQALRHVVQQQHGVLPDLRSPVGAAAAGGDAARFENHAGAELGARIPPPRPRHLAAEQVDTVARRRGFTREPRADIDDFGPGAVGAVDFAAEIADLRFLAGIEDPGFFLGVPFPAELLGAARKILVVGGYDGDLPAPGLLDLHRGAPGGLAVFPRRQGKARRAAPGRLQFDGVALLAQPLRHLLGGPRDDSLASIRPPAVVVDDA